MRRFDMLCACNVVTTRVGMIVLRNLPSPGTKNKKIKIECDLNLKKVGKWVPQ